MSIYCFFCDVCEESLTNSYLHNSINSFLCFIWQLRSERKERRINVVVLFIWSHKLDNNTSDVKENQRRFASYWNREKKREDCLQCKLCRRFNCYQICHLFFSVHDDFSSPHWRSGVFLHGFHANQSGVNELCIMLIGIEYLRSNFKMWKSLNHYNERS